MGTGVFTFAVGLRLRRRRWGPACRAWRLWAVPLPRWGGPAMQQPAGRAQGAVWGLVFQSGKGKGGYFQAGRRVAGLPGN